MEHGVHGHELGAETRVPRTPRAGLPELRRFELRLGRLCVMARVLPAITPRNAAQERMRLLAAVARGESPEPRWALTPTYVPAAAFRLLDALRAEAARLPAEALHAPKLDELELDLRIVAAAGHARVVRPLAARRFGTGALVAPTPGGVTRLSNWAREILALPPVAREERTLPADGPAPSVGAAARARAAEVGLDIEVRVDAALAAGAASAERTMFIADRRFGAREAMRFAVHEVLGHLVAADRGRRQPLRVVEWGTAGAFGDQEGVALHLEAAHGLMDAGRLRTLAARVTATDLMHAGATFGETTRRLVRDHGFDAADAVAIAERAFRGGGVARDAAYAHGFLRVRDALARGACTLDELRLGRTGLDALPHLRALMGDGWVTPVRARSV